MQKRLEQGTLNLKDVVEQVKSMSSMGGFSKIKDLIPGLGKAKIPEGQLESQEAKVAKWEHILKSMTREEIENPELLEKQTSRINRISKGSGVTNTDIRSLLKQYRMLQSFVKDSSNMNFDPSQGLNQKQMMKLAKKFGKMKKFKM